ncbi:hypothetical protein CENSYa_1467 [Cenarchaeum symbiosum A]|uniref:Uncharacterized protein n=1 Tax=Cenarchaeum symbiosum (strain A) TaxID=414004 RepID=A0RXM2_CENSY|nr:hypothetical protein CENSYa_1467 [Cenarchaeum symbiosum A]
MLSVQMDLLKERPVIYYTPLDNKGHYICYGFKRGREESCMVDAAGDNSQIYSPVVRIKALPNSLRAGNGEGHKYQPIELEDLASLARLSYGYEETPFPVFAFPRGGRWFTGVFVNFSEEGASYFCHVVLDEEPSRPFIRFSSNGAEPSFVDNISEHGYSYIKVIKLKETHPLVDYEQIQR